MLSMRSQFFFGFTEKRGCWFFLNRHWKLLSINRQSGLRNDWYEPSLQKYEIHICAVSCLNIFIILLWLWWDSDQKFQIRFNCPMKFLSKVIYSVHLVKNRDILRTKHQFWTLQGYTVLVASLDPSQFTCSIFFIYQAYIFKNTSDP